MVSRPSHLSRDQVPLRKRTELDLYVTASQAFAMWSAKPDSVKIFDVRTPEEYIFVGHAEMAHNVPLLFIQYSWDTEKDEPTVRPNPHFAAAASSLINAGDTIVVMCRSGDRSALAVNALAQAGFERIFNVIDGFEGDKVEDPASAYHGQRMKNGWKNSGAPWTYDCDQGLLWIERNEQT